jgi:hypothetical protein
MTFVTHEVPVLWYPHPAQPPKTERDQKGAQCLRTATDSQARTTGCHTIRCVEPLVCRPTAGVLLFCTRNRWEQPANSSGRSAEHTAPAPAASTHTSCLGSRCVFRAAVCALSVAALRSALETTQPMQGLVHCLFLAPVPGATARRQRRHADMNKCYEIRMLARDHRPNEWRFFLH